jgi:hypothetical protein
MIDLIQLIHEIITFGVHEQQHGLDDTVLFLISLGIWWIIYKTLRKLTGLRWER